MTPHLFVVFSEMKIYIDTETFHAVPALYADAEKTKRLPTTIPVVEGWAQELSVGFLGAHQPAESATVRLVLAPPGSAVEVARSTDGVRSADASGNALYDVLLSIDTSAMRALLDAARAKTLPLVAGVLVTDAVAGTRVEYQFRVSVSESVIGVWETPVSMSELNLALGEARDAAQRAQLAAERLSEIIEEESKRARERENEIDAKIVPATTEISGMSKLSTATTMSVNDAEVGHDANGAARVASADPETNGTVYLPTKEWSALPNAAASLALLRTKANALESDNTASASYDDNLLGVMTTLATLGVTGAAADINTVTFLRRSPTTTYSETTQYFLRILKRKTDSNGNMAWEIAYQSDNAVAFGSVAEGEELTFFMRRGAGVEPPTTREVVAFVVVAASDAEVNAAAKWGIKSRRDKSGSWTSGSPSGWLGRDSGDHGFVPRMKMTWSSVTLVDPSERVAALEFRLAEAEARLNLKANSAVGGLEADASSADASVFGYVGPLADLGVSGSLAEIQTVTLFRRSGTLATTNPLYLRILRKVTDASGNKAWSVVFQSENAVSFADGENGDALPVFQMKRADGADPVSPTEIVAMCVVSAPDAEAGASVKIGYKMRNDVSGCLANLMVVAAIDMDRGGAAYAPRAVFTWTPVTKIYDSAIKELVARVSALEAALNS